MTENKRFTTKNIICSDYCVWDNDDKPYGNDEVCDLLNELYEENQRLKKAEILANYRGEMVGFATALLDDLGSQTMREMWEKFREEKYREWRGTGMTEKRFKLKIFGDVDNPNEIILEDSCGQPLASFESLEDARLVRDLLNELNDENEQLRKENHTLKQLLEDNITQRVEINEACKERWG